MTNQSDTSRQFERLSSEIENAERALRGRFTATPAPTPATLRRIKARLRSEALGLRPAENGRGAERWLRSLAATAATILLVVGFYATTGSRDSGHVAGSVASLEAFTASLPRVLSDEDTEITQLRSELRQLEAQTGSNASDTAGPDDPAAQRSAPDDSTSIAAV